MSVCKLPLFPASQVANLPECPSPMVSGDQTAAVFNVPCINDEKPSAADGALPAPSSSLDRKGGCPMVTYSDLIQIGILIVGIIALFMQANKKK